METAAHCQLYDGLTPTIQRLGKKAATLDLFLQQIMRRNTPPNIEVVVAYILYLMDIGYISAIAPVIPDSESPLCAHGIRVEPLSLTLGVQRFGSYLDLLIEMERHCLWGWSDMKEQLQEYVGAKYWRPELAARLWDFANRLHNAGQKFADWRAFYQSVGFPKKSSVIGDAQAYRKWYFTF